MRVQSAFTGLPCPPLIQTVVDAQFYKIKFINRMIDIVTKRYVGKIGCRLAVGLACMYGPLRASVHLSALVDNVRMARMNFKERTSTTQCSNQSPSSKHHLTHFAF